MAIVNFSINRKLEEEVNKAIEEKGFHSKAEFFRFAAFNYLQKISRVSEDEEFTSLTNKLTKLLKEKVDVNDLSSFEEQMKNYK